MTGRDDPQLRVDDVAELRALFRRPDPVARRLGLALLHGWAPARLDAVGARAVLEAVGGTYPRIEGEPADPAEELARLLWDAPRLVAVPDVLRVYLIAGVRARRALLALLAIRGGAEGLAGLEVLLGPDADPAGIPAPTTPVLEPLAAHPDPGRVAGLLCVLLGRPAWRWHAAELLSRLVGAGRLPDPAMPRLRAVLAAAVDELVECCDEAASEGGSHREPARGARETLRRLVPLLDAVHAPGDCDALDGALARLLASADPVAAALAVRHRVRTGEPVAPERAGLLARDPEARVELFDSIGDALATLRSRDPCYDDVAIAEGRLVRFLAGVTELGRPPEEIEHVGELAAGGDVPGTVQLFRFRMRAPHWSAARGWMIGASGAFTTTCYDAEDERPPNEHVAAMRTALAAWPDRRSDGAA